MVFAKPLSEVTFGDVKTLMQNKIPESDVLDYKSQLVDDDQLLKHVCAFANSRGGFIAFGVEETGKGGLPRNIPGVNSIDINKERMEQIILSNISPRVQTKIAAVEHEAKGKSVLIVQVPDSALKPHMNLRNRKFYRRYEFEAVEMDEREVSDAYRRRFITYQEVDEYVRGILTKPDLGYRSLGQVVVIPAMLGSRLFESSDDKTFSWLDPNKINPQPAGFGFAPNFGYVPGFPRPSPNGVICEQGPAPTRYLELHRNGCLEYGDEFGFAEVQGHPELAYFPYVTFCLRLLHTLQFASMVYTRYNYFGDVRIVASVKPSKALVMPTRFHMDEQTCKTNSILVMREFSTEVLESNYSYIASGMMHEVFNHFGFWKCPLFDDKGDYISEKFAEL
jgi:hypothetical protein